MNKKRSVTLEVLPNVEKKFPEMKEFIELNMKEVCEREIITMAEIIYFALFAYMMYDCI